MGPLKGNASHRLSDEYVHFERTDSNMEFKLMLILT
jgi:hypothetical protein